MYKRMKKQELLDVCIKFSITHKKKLTKIELLDLIDIYEKSITTCCILEKKIVNLKYTVHQMKLVNSFGLFMPNVVILK